MVVDRVAGLLGARFRKPLFRRHLVALCSRGGKRHALVKPTTFMNLSGSEIPGLLRRHGGELLVVYDNVDLAPGRCRLKLKGSSGGHRGLESVAQTLGSGEFPRLAVGIGRPAGGGDLTAHVLSRPGEAEAEALEQGVERASRAVLDALERGVQKVMNELNRRDPEPPG